MLLHEAGASTRDRGAPISISTHSEQRWSWTAAASHSSDGRIRRHCSRLSRPAGAGMSLVAVSWSSWQSPARRARGPIVTVAHLREGRVPRPAAPHRLLAPGCRSPASAHDLGDELAAAAQGPSQRGVGPALRLGLPEPVDDLVALGPVARGLGVGLQGLGVQLGGARRQGVGRARGPVRVRMRGVGRARGADMSGRAGGTGGISPVAPAGRASGMRGVGAPSPGARPPRAHPAQRVRGHARTP